VSLATRSGDAVPYIVLFLFFFRECRVWYRAENFRPAGYYISFTTGVAVSTSARRFLHERSNLFLFGGSHLFYANAVGHIFPSSRSHWTRKKNPQSIRILEESFSISIITRIELLAFAFRGGTIPVPAGQVLCQGLHNDGTTVFVQAALAQLIYQARIRQISAYISGS
jgi:hypothetical protein